MESSRIMIKYPFSHEWKIKKSDLEKLPDGKKYKSSTGYRACRSLNITYCLRIYPNETKNNPRGKTCLFFFVNPGNAKEVKAEYTLSIDSMNLSTDCNYTFKTKKGWGPTLCKIDDFFNPRNGYFINDELIVKINGTLEFERAMVTKLPICVQWAMKQTELTAIKASDSYGYLQSKRFNISSDSDIKYYLRFYPNANKEKYRGELILRVYLEFGNEKKIEAFLSISIESAQYSRYWNALYGKSESHGAVCTSIEELFDPNKKFIFDGEMIVNIKGFLLIEMEKIQNTVLTVKKGIATKRMKLQRNKNFTIIVGEHQIKVHKRVLAEASPVFAAMFESNMKEATENNMEITDFSFEVVRTATNLIYSTGIARTFPFEDMISLLQFSDKYDIQFIKDIVEEYFIKRISVSNVCQLFNYSKLFNAEKLNKKSIEFLVQCSKESTPVIDIESIDKETLAKIFVRTLCHFSEAEV